MPKNDTSNDTSTEAADSQGFYGRWSRRKQQARDGEQPVEDEVARQSTAAVAVTAETGEVDAGSLNPESETPAAPVLTDADMPTLESLGEESDYSGFMSEGVSEKLRNKALRQLFRGAQFNITDGLDDYDEDFRNFELLGDIVTSDMKYEREYEALRIREREEEQAALEQEREQTKALEEQGEEPLQVEGEGELEEIEVEIEERGETLQAGDESLVVVADIASNGASNEISNVSAEVKPLDNDANAQTIQNQDEVNVEVRPKAIDPEPQDGSKN